MNEQARDEENCSDGDSASNILTKEMAQNCITNSLYLNVYWLYFQ